MSLCSSLYIAVRSSYIIIRNIIDTQRSFRLHNQDKGLSLPTTTLGKKKNDHFPSTTTPTKEEDDDDVEEVFTFLLFSLIIYYIDLK